tara:strand:+ start:566 stop:1060 length:495 start_codon:yes stop_codon:yes gene_type:complete
MKVIKNFLDKKTHKTIFNIVNSKKFPLYYSDTTATDEDTSDYMFTHVFYEDGKQISYFLSDVLIPLLGKLSFNKLLRAKLNFYTKKPKHIQTAYHVDFPDKHTVALYSINTNNGYTLFKNGDKVKSVANQLLLFDGRLEHCSVNQTDKNVRLNLNINLECKENY